MRALAAPQEVSGEKSQRVRLGAVGGGVAPIWGIWLELRAGSGHPAEAEASIRLPRKGGP